MRIINQGIKSKRTGNNDEGERENYDEDGGEDLQREHSAQERKAVQSEFEEKQNDVYTIRAVHNVQHEGDLIAQVFEVSVVVGF